MVMAEKKYYRLRNKKTGKIYTSGKKSLWTGVKWVLDQMFNWNKMSFQHGMNDYVIEECELVVLREIDPNEEQRKRIETIKEKQFAKEVKEKRRAEIKKELITLTGTDDAPLLRRMISNGTLALEREEEVKPLLNELLK